MRVFEKNSLVSDEFTEPVAILVGITIDVADFREFLTVRLADVLYRDLPDCLNYCCF
jgi:hypothetical protein